VIKDHTFTFTQVLPFEGDLEVEGKEHDIYGFKSPFNFSFSFQKLKMHM
jgi:hypothetical protein